MKLAKHKIFVGIILLTTMLFSCDNSPKFVLETASKEKILNVLTSNSIIEKNDISGGNGIGEIIITLEMGKDMNFNYRIEESYVTKTNYSSMNANGTFEIIGNVKNKSLPGWKDKKGNDVGKYQFEQHIKFTGLTNSGNKFNFTGKLVQFGDNEGIGKTLFFGSDDFAISGYENLSLRNYRLPNKNIDYNF